MGTFEAQTGFSNARQIRLANPDSRIPFTQTRPVVDTRGIATRAFNEVISLLAECQEKQKSAQKSFLRKSPVVPEINIMEMASNLW